MNLVSSELDYQPVSVSHPTYTYSRVTPQVALDATDSILNAGGQESIFELSGSKVYNLGRSVLSCTVTAQGDGGLYKWFHCDGISLIRQIQLYNREGLYLCDVQQANIYTKCINRRSNKISDVQTHDKVSDGAGYFSGIFCANSAAAATGPPCRPNTTSPKTSFIEPAYCIGGSTTGATPVINVQIPLSAIKDTILGMDKNQYFGNESVYLRIVWAPATDVLWKSSSGADPTDTAVVAYGANITVAGLTLYTAIEQNPVIVQSLKDKFQSGTLTYQIPFVYMNLQSLGTETTHNLSVRYSRAHGQKLKKLIWSPFTGANNLKYNNSNLAAVKIVSHYKMVNNVRTTQYDLTPSLEWLDSKDRLRGSCIMSSEEFDYNYASVLDFTNQLTTETNSNLDVGLDLSEEAKIDIQATTAGVALTHYLFGITLKQLTISPAGSTLV